MLMAMIYCYSFGLVPLGNSFTGLKVPGTVPKSSQHFMKRDQPFLKPLLALQRIMHPDK